MQGLAEDPLLSKTLTLGVCVTGTPSKVDRKKQEGLPASHRAWSSRQRGSRKALQFALALELLKDTTVQASPRLDSCDIHPGLCCLLQAWDPSWEDFTAQTGGTV